MSNKTKFMVAVVLACVFVLSALPIGVFAESVQTSNSIFNLTGTYGSQLHGNTLLQADSDEKPSITIFTHGMGGNVSHWGGSVPVEGDSNSQFALDGKSMPVQLKEQYDAMHPTGEAEIYIAHSDVTFVESKDVYAIIDEISYHSHEVLKNENDKYFSLFRIEKINGYYETRNLQPVDLSSISFNTHTIIVYQDSGAWEKNILGINIDVGIEQEMRYNEFHYIIDAITNASRLKHNQIPRINLIGHSLGGIINMMYANDHKYNVDSLVSLGSPYNGSWLGIFSLKFKASAILATYDINKKWKNVMNDWNDNQTGRYVNAKVVSSEMTDAFLGAIVLDTIIAVGNTIEQEIKGSSGYLYNKLKGDSSARRIENDGLVIAKAVEPTLDIMLKEEYDPEIVQKIENILYSLISLPYDEDESFQAFINVLLLIIDGAVSLFTESEVDISDMGDVLVSIASQQARGIGEYENIPESNIYHYVFNVVKKQDNGVSFNSHYTYSDGTEVDLLDLKSVLDQPAVPHNLIARNPTIIDYVINNIDMHLCDYTYESNNDDTHTKSCACVSVVEEHDYTYSQISQISPNCVGGGASPMAVVLPQPSNNLYVHRATCTTCAYTTQLGHNWTEFGTGYKCGDCLLYSTNIPIARPDNRFTLQQQIAIGTLLEGQSVAISGTEQVTLIGGVYYLSHVNVGLEPVLPPAEDC